ncbi:segregation/condensation protein A [Thermobifida halotolerans]|uniref:Segregation and condensation protein A n=1 Tax=Thermobifida halotolerans TaxID=483545 RepID=A0A399G1M4_9ACTN|nr:ScpA family protein [Thermobifida halotolerans]UOE20316.1 segregation/condensation protein A [Thermobifida halotolerans]
MTTPETPEGGFLVHLDNFEGPFDLLLALIAKHRLDITEVALSRVTDEFIAHIKAYGDSWDLDLASNFLLVAATLLDLKAARLLPRGEVEDEADLALLEARDLLFARLLQYRAYKEVAALLSAGFAAQGRCFARAVPLEPRFAALRPDVLLRLGPREFAALAARTLTPREPPSVPVAHIHQPKTSVAEQAVLVVAALREHGRLTFAELTRECAGTFEVVARFLALLELYRADTVGFDQPEPLGELLVTWTGSGEGEVTVVDDYGRTADRDDEETQ